MHDHIARSASIRHHAAASSRLRTDWRLEPMESRTLLSGNPWPNIGPFAPQRDLTVMSQNLYVGFDITDILSASSLAEVPALVSQAWADVQQTNFPERAQVIADEIADARPDVVGLQEATLWLTQAQGDFFLGNPTPATDVALDYLQVLVQALQARGLDYRPASTVDNFDIELPNAQGGDVRMIDRDAILVRADLPRTCLSVISADSAQYATTLPFQFGQAPGPVIQLNIPRGWTSVDVKVHGKAVHVVETHLETFNPLVQAAQALELLAGPARSNLPTVLMGDLNSNADPNSTGDLTPTYGLVLAAGFKDAWTATHGAERGDTWGQAADLRNTDSTLSERIDFIFYRGKLKATAMDIVGDEPEDKTASGLWPSDHAGIVASLSIGATSPFEWPLFRNVFSPVAPPSHVIDTSWIHEILGRS